MRPKTELLVFNKKEVGVIIMLLVLVALFSFTLGLRMGKELGVAKATPAESAPLKEKAELEHAEKPALPVESAHAHEESGKVEMDHAGLGVHESGEKATTTAAPQQPHPSSAALAEDHADTELSNEIAKGKVGLSKPVPMSFPKEKKAAINETGRYTLQVGSHRTIAEAAEQVSLLKRNGFDAFYLEVKIPGKGTWYRVGMGSFATKEIAEHTASQWKESKSLPPYIVQKINSEE